MSNVLIWQFNNNIFNRALKNIINILTVLCEFPFNIKKSGNGRATGNRLISILPYDHQLIFGITL
ncbi:hypothetical protein D3C76_1630130 [compost metagenome]